MNLMWVLTYQVRTDVKGAFGDAMADGNDGLIDSLNEERWPTGGMNESELEWGGQ